MYLETESTVEDGEIVALKKLRIEGEEEELRQFAFAFMDAIQAGKVKRRVGETKVVIKLIP